MDAVGPLKDEVAPDVSIIDFGVPRIRQILVPLSGYLRRRRPVAMLACMWPLTAVTLLARWASGAPTRVVVAEHTTWSRDRIAQTRLGRWQVRESMHWLFRFADGVVAVSYGAADDLARFARIRRDRISVIYNPVVGKSRRTAAKDLAPSGWWTGSHKRILAVGTLKAEKDFQTLLKAFAILRGTINARLLILGEGECRSELERSVCELGLREDVFLPGFARDPSAYYARADLHVLSSTSEGLPTVLIEALEAGIPVVSTDCPSGPREILLGGRYGRLVPVGDATALAGAIRDALTAPHDKCALQLHAQTFSIDKAVDAYEELLLTRAAKE